MICLFLKLVYLSDVLDRVPKTPFGMMASTTNMYTRIDSIMMQVDSKKFAYFNARLFPFANLQGLDGYLSPEKMG
jgi:hypothetical protein